MLDMVQALSTCCHSAELCGAGSLAIGKYMQNAAQRGLHLESTPRLPA